MSMIVWVNRVFVVVLVTLFSIPCFAVEIMEKNGKKGVFLTEAEFDKVLAERTELNLLKTEKIPQLELKISKLDLLVLQKDQEIKILDDIIAKKDELFTASLKLKDAEIASLNTKIDKLDSWRKSPSLFLLSGVVLGGLLAVGLEFGISEAKR